MIWTGTKWRLFYFLTRIFPGSRKGRPLVVLHESNLNLIQPTISLEMPVPSQGHYGFHSFPVVDWFCLFIWLWVLTFPLWDCSEFGNFVITFISSGPPVSSTNKSDHHDITEILLNVALNTTNQTKTKSSVHVWYLRRIILVNVQFFRNVPWTSVLLFFRVWST